MSLNNLSPKINTNDKTSKLHFTPCRRLGLKRKSPLSESKNSINSESPIELGDSTPKNKISVSNSNSPESFDQNTPKRKQLSKIILKNVCLKKIIYENPQGQENIQDKIYTKNDLEQLNLKIKETETKIENIKTNLHLKKHDVNNLKELSSTWKNGCEEALYRLLEITKSQGYSMTMDKLLEALKIPPELVGYDVEEEDFS